jgi:hypothetical protein
MAIPDRFRVEVRMACDHATPCVIDRLSANTKADSNRQLAAVVAIEPAEMVRRRRVRTADMPVEPTDLF